MTNTDSPLDDILVKVIQTTQDDIDGGYDKYDQVIEFEQFLEAKAKLEYHIKIAEIRFAKTVIDIGAERAREDDTYSLDAFIEDAEEYLERKLNNLEQIKRRLAKLRKTL